MCCKLQLKQIFYKEKNSCNIYIFTTFVLSIKDKELHRLSTVLPLFSGLPCETVLL